jgi:hypothetical protein
LSGRLAACLAAIDEMNAGDPVMAEVDGRSLPRALLYGHRMSAALADFAPEASELLQIAARAQHVERWIIPRQSYPEGRAGYLHWRRVLQQHHGVKAGEAMALAGYNEDERRRVALLLRKAGLASDPEVQALEDVVCLVFLAYEAPDFIARHDDAKVTDILVKTMRKMSPAGLAAAGKLTLEPRLARLLQEAAVLSAAGR